MTDFFADGSRQTAKKTALNALARVKSTEQHVPDKNSQRNIGQPIAITCSVNGCKQALQTLQLIDIDAVVRHLAEDVVWLLFAKRYNLVPARRRSGAIYSEPQARSAAEL